MRAKGYIPSPPEKVGMGHPGHLLAASVPDVVSHRSSVVEILNQGSTSSCVAHGVTQQIRTQLAMQGIVAPALPSRLFTYYVARKEGFPNQPVTDDGTYIHSAYEGLSAVGFPPESAWTFSEDLAKVNAQPDWEAFREAIDQRWLSGFYRISSTGFQRVEDVKAALAAGHCVTWGTSVDQAFEDLTPDQVWPGVRGAVLGGHCTLLVGYRPGVFEVCNSWGYSWCDSGFCTVSENAIASPDASDFWVATIVPQFSGT